MNILSIHCGHTSTVGLMKDGRVVAIMSEERLRRIKNYSGFPSQALTWIQENYLKGESIDLVVLPSNDPAFYFSRGQYEENLIHSPILSGVTNALLGGSQKSKEKIRRSGLVRFVLKLFPSAIHIYRSLIYKFIDLNKNRFQKKIIEELSKRLNIAKDKIVFDDHHTMHGAAALLSIDHTKPWLVFTCDGYGDNLCASVSKYENGVVTKLAVTPDHHSLGMLYGYTTRYLGMKMNEHEFKVMGLAPYAKDKGIEPILDKLRSFIWLDPANPLVFKSKRNLMWADLYLDELYKGHRFDSIAGAVQKRTEELLCDWVRAGIKQTGIPNVAFGGGVFMNVKAAMYITDMPEVKDVYVMPSAGDESLVLGGMFKGYRMLHKEDEYPEPIQDLYLGNEFSDSEVAAFIEERKLKDRHIVEKMENAPAKITDLLLAGNVVARLNGRMEWGARALGNRSILADPRRHDTIRIINEMIKDRDFWMPFTPSMLDSDAERYLVNPKHIKAPYMCLAFGSTEAAQKDLIAALHPYDFTVRPQVVYREWNPSYYDLLTEFKNRTGVGAVLNTSFNLHGEPNVCSLDDALRTLENSGLKYLVLGSYLISKKS